MTITRVQLVGNVSTGASFSGIVTATSFSGNVTGNATGLSGTPNITVGNVTGSAATFTNLTVNGTQTIINTTSLEIADKTVGIASTSSPTDANADGAGIVVYGTTNKSLTWNNTSKNWGLVGGGLTVASGPFIVGSATSTGTASQTLQVTGGGYVSGDVGIGTTRPTSKLHVIGGIKATTSIDTDTQFLGQSNDTVSTPSFSWTSDTTTGFYRPSSGNLGFTISGTEQVRFSATGVGIGTTNPTAKLQVQGNTNINNTLPTTVSYGSSFSVGSQEATPQEIAFSNDGRTMYILGSSGDDITWYTLSTPWNVTTASHVSQFSVASQITVPAGLTFKPDGTKFYIIGTTGTVGAGATSVSEYFCATPWDLTTAGYTTSYSVISQTTSPNDVEFSTDGTKFYVLDSVSDFIQQYTCSTPWSVASGVSVGSSLSIASQETVPTAFAFSQDGTKLLLTGSSGDDINYYTLSTPWNITTTSFVGIITSIGSGIFGETSPAGLYWKPDGTKLYLTGTTTDTVWEFNVTSNAQLEVTGKTLLYGDTEVHENLDVYGESYFGNKVGVGTINPTSTLHVVGGDSRFGGVIETVSAATTYVSSGRLVLELDVRQATTYTYTMPTGANIGVVSFRNMPAQTGRASGTTVTCIFTQNAAGTGNTTPATGIGTNCTVIGYENGASVAGISTRALVSLGSTVILSPTANDRDFVSFFIHYTGGTNTTASSYQVYATKNGNFAFGNIGV